MSDHTPLKPAVAIKGRGATRQIIGRFETQYSELEDDGWTCDSSTGKLATEVSVEVAKTILTRNQSPIYPLVFR